MTSGAQIRLYLTVAAAAIVAAGLAVGLTLDTRTTPHQPKGAPGKPPIPRLSGSVGAEIVAAFSEWPHGSIDAMQRLGLQHAGGKTVAARRTSSVVQYYRGVALLWAGYPRDAEAALELAKKLGTQHDLPQPRPTTSSTRTSSRRRPAGRLPGLHPDRL